MENKKILSDFQFGFQKGPLNCTPNDAPVKQTNHCE